jgi:hypothetical protein
VRRLFALAWPAATIDRPRCAWRQGIHESEAIVSRHQRALFAQPMYSACDLIPINAWQRLDDVVHRAGTREGSDDVVHRGGDRRHGSDRIL